MNSTPAHFQDARELLTPQGFTVGEVWYHGTSSALLPAILSCGLKRSGDQAMKQAAKQTMATIGNHYRESIEPVFLTQSKELAYYWASQTVRNRGARVGSHVNPGSTEIPVVVEVNLPAGLREGVKPDVGAISLLMVKDGEQFLAHVAGLYQAAGQEMPTLDLMKANRLEFLHKLGMAYYNDDIDAQYVREVTV